MDLFIRREISDHVWPSRMMIEGILLLGVFRLYGHDDDDGLGLDGGLNVDGGGVGGGGELSLCGVPA